MDLSGGDPSFLAAASLLPAAHAVSARFPRWGPGVFCSCSACFYEGLGHIIFFLIYTTGAW